MYFERCRSKQAKIPPTRLTKRALPLVLTWLNYHKICFVSEPGGAVQREKSDCLASPDYFPEDSKI